jgi:hypothetical protein
MATQLSADHAVLFDNPAELGPAIADAIDRFAELSAGAAKLSEQTRANATGTNLVRHLLASVPTSPTRSRDGRRRILFVMNGDAMVLHNGASRVAEAQLRYLNAAGYDIVGLFLTYNSPANTEAFARWGAALGRSLAPFLVERMFVAGPGRWGFDPDQSPALRETRLFTGGPLKSEFDFIANFEFNAALLNFLRTHPVDAVLLNYITNFPVVEALGLGNVPVICEMHDVQSLQRAIYGNRPVDARDLDEEFKWLGRCAALVSLNARETAITRQRLPAAVVETTGVFLPDPLPSSRLLAGAKDLAEIVSSTGPRLPEYKFEAAWEIGRIESVERLIAAGSLDLLYVSSAHSANVSGLRWFFSQVYEPYLAERQISMVVAGSICRVGDWPRHPRLFFVDQVEDLGPLYAAARVVVLPITEGAGSPVKTYEALAYGRPIVGTSHAFRGVDSNPGEFIIQDDPADFADAVIELLDSAEARQQAAALSRRAAARLNDFARYFEIMDRVFAQALPDAGATTPPPEAAQTQEDYVEWPSALLPVNRLLRSYADGEPLEGWALERLAQESELDVERLLDSVGRSLFLERDAPVLRTEQRLKPYLANPQGARMRDGAVFAVRLALAGRRGAGPGAAETDGTHRVIASGELPLTVASLAEGTDGNRLPLRIDDRAPAGRSVPDPRRLVGRAHALHAELPALEGGYIGMRTIAVEHTTPNGEPAATVFRQSIRISPGLRLLGREVFGGGFEIPGNGTGASLPPGGSGRLALPRITDGRYVGYADLCFAQTEGELDPSAAAQRSAPAIMVLLDDQPVGTELVTRAGRQTIIRVFLGIYSEVGDFGIAQLTIVNQSDRLPLRLVAVHSGLLVGPVEQATAIATVLSLPKRNPEQMNLARAASLARAAIAMIIDGVLPDASALETLAAFLETGRGRDSLRSLLAQELARAAQGKDAARYGAGHTDSVMQDIAVIVGTLLGSGEAETAIVSPALPVEVVDRGGSPLPAHTAALTQQRAGLWRVPMLQQTDGERIKIDIDAKLDVGYPGVIEITGFHGLEHPEARHRWTGPEATAKILIPVALNRPARLSIELGPTGRNTAPSDFVLACNGKPVPHTLQGRPDGVTLLADLPVTRSAAPHTELSLTIRHLFQKPPDLRVLGVVFRSLSLLLDALTLAQPARRGPSAGIGEEAQPPLEPAAAPKPADGAGGARPQ